MKVSDYFNIRYSDGFFEFINQTKLPFEEKITKTDDYEVIAQAIERLEIRGAPAIGIAAAFGLLLSQKKSISESAFLLAYDRLKNTRPTAVNLFIGLEYMKEYFLSLLSSIKEKPLKNFNHSLYISLELKALEFMQNDILSCKRIAENGIDIFAKKSNVLTHCNTGKLATGGDGTAFAVIKLAHEKNLINHVYADETRPLLQGSRLTAYELNKAGIPFSIITDSTAGFLMQQGKIDLVITGADRIAANGDVANKIGTYSIAVLAHFHKIPFYIAAPQTTFDKNIISLHSIPIELRKPEEISAFGNIQVTDPGFNYYNPAFDTIPANLITKIITD
ncbi:MAG: S-methyl-5-thioribose-1-phosphate isomerase [Ignavibacteriales bacterium]|nr:S-methyl-5-thioribose-1-phosphate isomerase [Ignavibacteriales bacterium]